MLAPGARAPNGPRALNGWLVVRLLVVAPGDRSPVILRRRIRFIAHDQRALHDDEHVDGADSTCFFFTFARPPAVREVKVARVELRLARGASVFGTFLLRCTMTRAIGVGKSV